jgi:hypothetical protein
MIGYLSDEGWMMERKGSPENQPILLLPGPENVSETATGSSTVNGKQIAVDQENGQV